MFNPASHPLFTPLFFIIGGALAAGFVYALVSERKQLERFGKSSLFQRWLSSAILAPLAMLCLLSGTAALTILVTIMTVIGMLEYFRLVQTPPVFVPAALAAGLMIPTTAALAPQYVAGLIFIALFCVATLTIFEYNNDQAKKQAGTSTGTPPTAKPDIQLVYQAALAFLGVIYIPFLGSYLIHLHRQGGAGLVLALIASVGLSDTLALVLGKLFGRRKLAPQVSPNKTIAGAIGNLVGAYAGFLALKFACPELPLWVSFVLPAAIALAALFGDLFESVLKRTFNVKDAGNWLPGFGGLLDRIDSILFAMPVSYYLIALAL